MMKIKVFVEPRYRGYREYTEEIPDEEWAAMSEKERDARLLGLAVDMQNEDAPCGAEAIEEQE